MGPHEQFRNNMNLGLARSWIIDRSNSAQTPMTPKSALPAGRRRRINALLVNEQVHFLGVDLGEEVDQV